MYFKKLEIIGFKSFAEKTILYFEPGITTVVGPNGCGKSNIIDAIRWVLGEQSVKSLRGSKMEDVIFNGTDEREPVNMAEVSLTLSNKDKVLPIDSAEVVVSRKLFRSGESEYLINKAPVRLKDISELFMGTGIGAEAYSIIGQGKIDMILSSRPEERRFIFEEASGITKYKSKRKEAVRKLEATDNNLLRVSDIIAEVKRQINSITRQATKAERYKERFDRLKDMEFTLASYEYGLLNKKREDIEARSSKVREEIRSAASEIERLQAELRGKKEVLAGVEEKFTQARSEKFSRESAIEQSRNKIGIDRERITELASRIEALKNETDSIRKREESAQALMREFESKLSAVSDSDESKRVFLSEKEDSLKRLEAEIRENDERIKDSKQVMVDYMAEKAKSRNEIVRVTSDIQNRSLRLRRLDLSIEKASAEAAAAKEKFDAIAEEFEKARSGLNAVRSERERLQKEIGGLSRSLDFSEKRLQDERNILIALESKKAFLEDIIARQEGFAGGVKSLLGAIKKGEVRIDGIKGVLGNMVEPARGCESAVETALGDYAQGIISEDRESALRAAEYLNDNERGRATFIILDELPVVGDAGGELPQGISGVLGKMKDFVKAAGELENAVRHILKGTYLVKSADVAKEAFGAFPRNAIAGIRLVTKRGEMFRSGFITGGANPKGENAGIIGRQARLNDTMSAIASSGRTIEGMEKEIRALEPQLAALKTRQSDIESVLKEQEAEYHKRESRLSSAEQQHSRVSEEISMLELEKDEVKEEVRDLGSAKNEFTKRLEDIEAEENNMQNVLFDSQELVKNFSKEREETVVLIAKINTEIHAFSKEKESLSRSLEGHRESYDTYAKLLLQKAGEMEEAGKRKDELVEEIAELEPEITRLSKELNILNEELKETDGMRSRSISAIEAIDKSLADLYSLSTGRKDSEHNLEMQKSEIGFKIGSLKTRMAQLYKIDIELNGREYDPALDWDAMRRDIEELNRKLESMGTVNLVAIEEHKELEDRFNFLNHQKDDLTKAKDDLNTAIAKINKTTRKLFLETFEKIQFEFKNYFRYLFGGGQADIFLADERDVLESGIEIVVKPPGKKLQNITLLSGGEKALTAIALVYAIFKVKPSPFCLLDEVDAPLDESNISRFSKALREFTKKSQFIVITHNKRTITLADVMYGITMEKSGISKIVSVKFHEESKEKEAVLT